MEERVARLESDIEHIRSDIADVKAHVQRLDQKFDAKFDAQDQRIDAVQESLERKIDTLKDSMFEFRLATERSFSRLTLWGLTLYIAFAASMLGVMAKGFGWIK